LRMSFERKSWMENIFVNYSYFKEIKEF